MMIDYSIASIQFSNKGRIQIFALLFFLSVQMLKLPFNRFSAFLSNRSSSCHGLKVINTGPATSGVIQGIA